MGKVLLCGTGATLNPQVKLAYSYWKVGFQYLDLSECVSREIVKTGNTWVLIQEGTNWAEQEEKYEEMTKWADYNQGIPVIFNFYHGLELLLKGFLLAEGVTNKSHSVSELFQLVVKTLPRQEFTAVVGNYIDAGLLPKLLADFFNASNSSVDMWYQAFKYPEDMKHNFFDHSQLIYNGDEGSAFFAQLADDIHQIRVKAVAYAYNSYEGLT